MYIALEADDFGPLNHRFDVLEKLRDRYPNFKITMFTIPWDIRYNTEKGGTPIVKEEYSAWRNVVKHAIKDGWLEIAVHGFTHVPNEFGGIDARMADAKIQFAEKMFDDSGIKFTKIFKAPHWQLSQEGKEAIEKRGYKVVEDGYYNWNWKDEFPVELDDVIGHGHVQNVCDNGLEEALIRLVQIPNEYEFKFLSEAL
jgi:hypothetical protein